MADEQSREDKLASMARRFVDRAREQAARIAELRLTVQREQGKGDALKEMRQLVHSLHGSGGTFGFGEISDAAGTAEDYCDGLIASGDAPAVSQFADLDRAVEKLLALVKEINSPQAK
jgi:chemotaxis protein histidine kinase CheA